VIATETSDVYVTSPPNTTITLSPGGEVIEISPALPSDGETNWQRMSATPDNFPSALAIVTEWVDKGFFGDTTLSVHWRNIGQNTVVFRSKRLSTPIYKK